MKWTVVANRSEATIYQPAGITRNGTEKLVKLMSFSNPLGRLRNSKMQTDAPGKSRGKFRGSSPHNLTGGKNPHDETAKQFARWLAKHLSTDLRVHQDLTFRIAAEAKFLGLMKMHFSKPHLKRIQWVRKDFMHVPQNKWAQLI